MNCCLKLKLFFFVMNRFSIIFSYYKVIIQEPNKGREPIPTNLLRINIEIYLTYNFNFLKMKLKLPQ